MIRYFAYFLFLSLIYSSCKDDDRLYLGYIKQFDESIKLLDRENTIIYTDFKDLMIDHGAKLEPYYKKMMEVKKGKNTLFELLDNIVLKSTKIPSEKIHRNSLDKKTVKAKVKLDKADIVMIIKNIEDYKTLILETIYNPQKNNKLIEFFDSTLSTKKFNSSNTFSANSVSLAKLLASIYKLKADVTIAEFITISKLRCCIDVCWYNISKREVLIVPNSQIVPVGKPYNARIFFSYCDTTAAPIFEIEGKRYETISGKGVYKCKVLEKSGKHEKNGNFMVKSPYTGEIRKIPFKIEYEVLEKK